MTKIISKYLTDSAAENINRMFLNKINPPKIHIPAEERKELSGVLFNQKGEVINPKPIKIQKPMRYLVNSHDN